MRRLANFLRRLANHLDPPSNVNELKFHVTLDASDFNRSMEGLVTKLEMFDAQIKRGNP